MGMYTELVMACELKRDVDEIVIKTLQFMAGNNERPTTTPEHKLFHTDRWQYMLVSYSYYFDGDTNSTIRYDEIAKAYILTVRCNLKNYCNEIEKFLDWIVQYSYSEGFVGYNRYEESENPTLIYFKNGQVERLEVEYE